MFANWVHIQKPDSDELSLWQKIYHRTGLCVRPFRPGTCLHCILVMRCRISSLPIAGHPGHDSEQQNCFTVKSASGAEPAGLKDGAYFPAINARDLPRNASTILLIGQETTRIGALVEGCL